MADADEPKESEVEQELADARRARQGSRIEFYGGPAASAIPIALFIAWAIFQSGLLRIDDTVLRIDGAPDDAVDTRAKLRVESFDDAKHTGTATYLEYLDESLF